MCPNTIPLMAGFILYHIVFHSALKQSNNILFIYFQASDLQREVNHRRLELEYRFRAFTGDTSPLP